MKSNAPSSMLAATCQAPLLSEAYEYLNYSIPINTMTIPHTAIPVPPREITKLNLTIPKSMTLSKHLKASYMKNTISRDINLGKPTNIKTKTMLQKEDSKFQELHTFRPRIASESGQNRPLSIFEKLYESKATIQSKREKIKYEKENQEFNTYTFHPNITKPTGQKCANMDQCFSNHRNLYDQYNGIQSTNSKNASVSNTKLFRNTNTNHNLPKYII